MFGYICNEGLAIDNFESLMELQKTNGAKIDTCYKHHDSVEQMISALSGVIENRTKDDIASSQFVGIIVDESCDIAVYKKLIIYVQIIKDGKAQILFCDNKNVMDGKAETIATAINEFLTEYNIPTVKLAGLGADGAPVMTGTRTGVGMLLIEWSLFSLFKFEFEINNLIHALKPRGK